MKKIIYLLSFLVISAFSTVYAVTEQNNYVSFVPEVTNIRYIMQLATFSMNAQDSYAITADQPWGGVINYTSQNNFNVQAGRQASYTVVDWVEQQLQAEGITANQNNAIGNTKTDLFPKELNFAVEGTLTIGWEDNHGNVQTFNCQNVIVAQGHSGTKNNWWVFSNQNNGSSNPKSETLNLNCAGVQMSISAAYSDEFTFQTVSN